ncbi:MAG TPA: cation:proton antiporter [Myxococcales bacterium]|nr:cation:proton antiporter [Myxococcales bacterium]
MGRLRSWSFYALMLVAAGGLYSLVRWYGDSHLVAPLPQSGGPTFGSAAAGGHADTLPRLLLALVVVIATARALGTLFKWFQQPPVIGEIIAGILLGPSLLGRIAPEVQAFLLPGTVAPILQILAQVGVILFMFVVGMELDPALLRHRAHSTVAISHASIVVPFLLGAALSLALYPILSSRDVPFIAFSLFMGVSMSVTAFPVLARILRDRGIQHSHLGVVALTCAAVDDVTAWCLLAFVVSVVQAHGTHGLVTGALALVYIAAVFAAGRPLMSRLARRCEIHGLTQGMMAVVFVLLLGSALITDLIGIHAVFGAFAIGAAIPNRSRLARELTQRLEDLIVVLFLPAFFAFTGLRTQIGLVSGGGAWLLCLAIIGVASVGKFGGSTIAARLTGLSWRDSASLGILMNTRGLMELIVLNIGFELRVISPTLFAMLVLMALVTTFATTPVLHLLSKGQPDSASEQAKPAAEGAG